MRDVKPKLSLCIGVFLLSSAGVFAQVLEPEDPGLFLPSVLLEIEDVRIDSLQAVLPEEEDAGVEAVDIPLPEVGDISISDEAFDIRISDTAVQEQQARSLAGFYSEGLIGAGSMNHILGSVSLYLLGSEPRFRLHFSHEGLDGYGFRDVGSGFFHREDSLEGAITYTKDAVKAEGAVSYREEEEGMQQISSLYSGATNRLLSGDAVFGIRPNSQSLVQGHILGLLSRRALSGNQPREDIEWGVYPDLSASVELGAVTLRAFGYYGYTGFTGVSMYSKHRAGFRGGADIAILEHFLLEASVGFAYTQESDFRIPFRIACTGKSGEDFSFKVEGGFFAEEDRYEKLWRVLPFIAASSSLADKEGWYAKLDTKWSALPILTLESGLAFTLFTKELSVLPAPGTDGLFLFSQAERYSLKPLIALSWMPFEAIKAVLGWEGEFLTARTFEPQHSIRAEFEARTKDNALGGGFKVEFPFSPMPEMPIVETSGFFRVSDGVRFVLEADDLLSPLIAGGRTLWGPYVGPGLRVTVKTQISL